MVCHGSFILELPLNAQADGVQQRGVPRSACARRCSSDGAIRHRPVQLPLDAGIPVPIQAEGVVVHIAALDGAVIEIDPVPAGANFPGAQAALPGSVFTLDEVEVLVGLEPIDAAEALI